MLVNRRLELMFFCYFGLVLPNPSQLLYLMIIAFFSLNLFINYYLFKDIYQNKERQKEFLAVDEMAGKDKFKVKTLLEKGIYFISLIGMLIISFYLMKPMLIGIASITMIIEIFKIKKFKAIIKEQKNLK